MAINSIKSFPVLPVQPARQKDAADERRRQKQEEEDEEDNSQSKKNQSGSENGHIDEFA